MIVVASSCVVVLLTLFFNTAQTFLTAPAPSLMDGLAIYDVNDSKRAGSSSDSSNEVTIRDASTNENENDEDDERADEPEVRGGEQTLVVVEFESELLEKDDDDGDKGGKEGASDDSDNQSPLDPWSIVWYIGSFGGLVAFFLIVSCSEWCCRRGARQLNSAYVNRASNSASNNNDERPANNNNNVGTETPPPPYHLFAPPPYDSVNYVDLVDKTSGEKIDIFVISVPLPSTAHQPAPA